MALEQRLAVKQTQQLRMTPQLRQAIKILQVARGDLEQMIAEEVEQNPVLDEVPVEQVAESASRTGDMESTEAEATAPATSDKDTDADQCQRYPDAKREHQYHGGSEGGNHLPS